MSVAPAHTEESIQARLAALDVCTVSDAMDALGLSGIVDGLQPLWEGATVAGRAVTMRLAEGPAPAGSAPVHLGARAVGLGGPGRVIVIDNGGRDSMGSWGGLLSAAAVAQGVEGVVTDGACRDVDEARGLGFPVFARGGAVRTARGRVHEVSTNEPIDLAGVRVEPGDYVVADASGVAVIPAGQVVAVVAKAEQLLAREGRMLQALRSGVPAVQVLDGTYENALNPDAD